MTKKRVAILISGRGSNMQSLVKACVDPDYPAEIVLVISNKADAPGLQWAEEQGITTRIVDHKAYVDKTAFEDTLIQVLRDAKAEIVCLAGFMRVLSPHFFRVFGRPVINIHPSLLPKHKGLNTHQAALDAGDTEAGCSVHIVTEELDGGEVLLQKRVQIRPGDTADTLAARVLTEEHKAYPEALRQLIEKKYTIVIVHGTMGSPDINWFPWLKRELEALGHKVIVPRFPTPENQNATAWLEAFHKAVPDQKDLILVGHSIGATFLLHVLQNLDSPAFQTIFVAPVLGACGHPDYDALNKTFFSAAFDWDKIGNNAGRIQVFHGDDDPYVPLSHPIELAEMLDEQVTIVNGGGHLNAESGYTEFPSVLKSIETAARV